MIVLAFLLFSMAGEPDVMELRREYVRNGMTAYTEGNYGEAIIDFKKALALDTTDAPVAYNIACCYSLLDMKDSAITWIEKTIELGTYSFSGDRDFDNIRETEKFKELEIKAESLLKGARSKEWPSYIFIPPDYDSTKSYPVLTMLHGYGASPRSFIGDLAEFFTENGFIYIVPYGTEVFGLSSFGWGDVLKVEKKIIRETLNIIRKYSVDISNVILAGYSQGGSRTFSIAIRNPALFKGAIPIAGGFDEEGLKEHFDKLKGEKLRFYIMIGGKEREERLKGNQRAKELLEDYGIKVHLKVFPNVGHAFPGDPEKEIGKALDFILEQ